MEKNNEKIKISKPTFHVVLYQPEIPANTGNIGRLCVGANTELHIVKPMRFLLSDKYLKRAGLDYWDKLTLHFHESLDELIAKYPQNNFYYCTTKSPYNLYERKFERGDFFIFGPETRGIPEEILRANWQNTITIPMSDNIRSINLANSVAIVLYEGIRQVMMR